MSPEAQESAYAAIGTRPCPMCGQEPAFFGEVLGEVNVNCDEAHGPTAKDTSVRRAVLRWNGWTIQHARGLA